MKFICCLLFTLMSTSAFAQGQMLQQVINIDGIKRDYTTYIPAQAYDNMPLVISLHGGFASPEGQFRLADFRPVADKEHFIVVCPSSKRGWQDGRNIHGIDDVKFMSQLIDWFIQTYHINRNRVYVAGISKGGFMASRLACQLSNRVAAVAQVAATLNKNEGYAPQYPMPMLFIHGTKDKVFPYKGGSIFGREVYSHNDVVKKWVTIDNCNPQPVTTNTPDIARDGTSIVKEEYTNPRTGMQVISYTINNGGHTWPGGWQWLPVFLVGKTTHNLNACQAIWDFFKGYELK